MEAKQIINLGLGHLGAYVVTSLEPANTPIEKRMSLHYSHWRDSELQRGRWHFATRIEPLTAAPSVPSATTSQPYGYILPGDMLSPIRHKRSRWSIRGNNLYSPYATETLEYKARVPEHFFHPMFIDVLAARIAYENAEWVTQSNIKKGDAYNLYKDARKYAVAENALQIGPEEDTADLDEHDTWIQGRAGWNI